MSGLQQFHYRLFGLRIASEIELPELVFDESGESADVWIRRASLPEPQCGSGEVAASGRDADFFIEEVARYRISQGGQILVDAAPHASMRNVRLFLLGSAMGLLLHQRGSLPLHANAVEIGGRGLAFMGPSGSGKSTLASVFHERGCRVIADDVCVVSFGPGGEAVAHDGIPRLRLWEDALSATGRKPEDHEPSYFGDDNYRKFDVAMPSNLTATVPLAAIVLLAPGDEVQLLRIEGAEAVDALFANTYRGAFIPTAGDAEAHWRACIKLVSAVPLFRLARPLERSAIDRITELVETDLGLIAH